MRLPYCILNVHGDVLDGGELHFVEAAKSLKAARRRAKALAKLGPGSVRHLQRGNGRSGLYYGWSETKNFAIRVQVREKHSHHNLT